MPGPDDSGPGNIVRYWTEVADGSAQNGSWSTLAEKVMRQVGRALPKAAPVVPVSSKTSKQGRGGCLDQDGVDRGFILIGDVGNGPELWLNLQQDYDLCTLEPEMAQDLERIPTLLG